MSAEPVPTFVYRFFDAHGVLLYVGISYDPSTRWHHHRLTQPWWKSVTEIRASLYPSRTNALAEEYRAIKEERPLHNVIHADPPAASGPAQLPVSRSKRSIDPVELEAMLRSGTPLSPHEAAVLLGCNRASLMKYLNQGRTTTGMALRYIDQEGHRWIDVGDLTALLNMSQVVHEADRCGSCNQWVTGSAVRYRRELAALANPSTRL